MLGQKLKVLREAKGMVQRQVAAKLEVDTAYVSKIEGNEKPVSRNHLKKLSKLFSISEEELLTLWLANKLFVLAKDESVGLKAMEAAEKELKIQKKKRSE